MAHGEGLAGQHTVGHDGLEELLLPMSYSKNKSFGGMLQFNRRLNSKGRNMTLRADANYSDSHSNSLSMNTCISTN